MSNQPQTPPVPEESNPVDVVRDIYRPDGEIFQLMLRGKVDWLTLDRVMYMARAREYARIYGNPIRVLDLGSGYSNLTQELDDQLAEEGVQMSHVGIDLTPGPNPNPERYNIITGDFLNRPANLLEQPEAHIMMLNYAMRYVTPKALERISDIDQGLLSQCASAVHAQFEDGIGAARASQHREHLRIYNESFGSYANENTELGLQMIVAKVYFLAQWVSILVPGGVLLASESTEMPSVKKTLFHDAQRDGRALTALFHFQNSQAGTKWDILNELRSPDAKLAQEFLGRLRSPEIHYKHMTENFFNFNSALMLGPFKNALMQILGPEFTFTPVQDFGRGGTIIFNIRRAFGED